MPKRIQRKRVRGWRMPLGAVYVGRPSRFANPFKIDGLAVPDAAAAVTAFRAYLTAQPALVASIKSDIKGKDLACWCPENTPCHGDVLLEIANEGE